MSQDYIVGRFVREEKNRFLCTVEITGCYEECYIPSSCKLGNFLELAGKEVLLKENQNKNGRTRYAVYAIRLKRNYLVLRTAEANEIVYRAIQRRRFSYLGKRAEVEREKIVSGYKADIFLPETKTIIEVKSIISINSKALFPSVFSERANNQLKRIQSLLKEDYKFVYIFVSLNPYVKSVSLSCEKEQHEYRDLFRDCVEAGMEYHSYASKLIDGVPTISREIPTLLE